jgi:hypothetical protein
VTSESPRITEAQLRDALGALAADVRPAPDAYRRAHAGWRRRERKRRLILAFLIALVFATADAVGLWALNHADSNTHVIFSDNTDAKPEPIGRIGQP